jgi:hypothetical protein
MPTQFLTPMDASKVVVTVEGVVFSSTRRPSPAGTVTGNETEWDTVVETDLLETSLELIVAVKPTRAPLSPSYKQKTKIR